VRILQTERLPGTHRDLRAAADVRVRETVLIGDSEIDIQTGKTAGVFTIGVTYGFKTIDHVEQAQPDFILTI
jgi:phosphoglycolate phosphatase